MKVTGGGRFAMSDIGRSFAWCRLETACPDFIAEPSSSAIWLRRHRPIESPTHGPSWLVGEPLESLSHECVARASFRWVHGLGARATPVFGMGSESARTPTAWELRSLFRMGAIMLTSVFGCMTCALGGCGRITVAPSCSPSLAVGESGQASANPRDPGAVPTYEWRVIPATAGTLSNATAASTTFTAQEAGTATLHVTASDSIFLAVGECRVVVEASSGVVVQLTADTDEVVAGTTATLTCRSIGETPAVSTSFQQTAGTSLELTPIGGGQVTFTPGEAGDFTFRCTGASPGGASSEPSDLTVTVAADQGGGRPPRR